MQVNSCLAIVFVQVSLSVILTAVGVLIAALGDFSFDLFGYSLALISVFFQVIFALTANAMYRCFFSSIFHCYNRQNLDFIIFVLWG